ncbi:MAG: CoA transferase, partial [Dehalococcoidales bacterium]
DPQVQAREMVQQVDFPGLGEIPIPGFPVKMSLTPGSIRSHAPGLGEHNDYVYEEILGLDQDRISGLKEDGVI